MTTLLVGRGLLGRAVESVLVLRGETVHTATVPWSNHDRAVQALLVAAERAHHQNSHWRLAWCAGAGVMGSSAHHLDSEVEVFKQFIQQLPTLPAAAFVVSSAGGVYAGSSDEPPYTEESLTAPLNAYGEAKLRIEAAVVQMTNGGTSVCIGRITNLYGPGQDLHKPQGLVSQLCFAQLSRQPLRIYVSLDSLRDYLFIDDAAAIVCACLDRVAAAPPGTLITKIIASGQSRSVGAVVGESTRAFRRRPSLTWQTTVNPQVRDLRVRSVIWRDIDRLACTPFLVGLRRTLIDVERRICTGSLNDQR